MTLAVALLILRVLFALVLLPAFLIHGVWRGREASRAGWWLRTAVAGGYVLLVFLTGRWDWLSYYLRYLVAALFAVAAVAGCIRTRQLPGWPVGRPAWISAAGSALVAAVMLALVVIAARGLVNRQLPVSLTWPLRDGTYYVAHGGGSTLINYHHSHRAQRFALDVSQLNGLGARLPGIYSTNPWRYNVFGAIVGSPCDGTVAAAVDGLPDQAPPTADAEHPAGNHIVIACHGVRVELAHLQEGSVTVVPGNQVAAGDPLALVGNSGNTSEPHLHIHAVRGEAGGAPEEGVPMLFDAVFPVRNTIVRR